jgi:bifunctional enzyme CysN/CysC
VTIAMEVHPQSFDVTADDRAASLGQVPFVLWLTGLPAAGKSTLATGADAELHRRGHHSYVLDGDCVRAGLNSDLGFAEHDRAENIRRTAEVASLMVDAGLIVICSLISPFRADRALARSRFEAGRFLEVFVDVPLEVAQARDPKGLYARARRGEIPNLTGVGSPYEAPETPDLRIDTSRVGPEQAAAVLIGLLERRSLVASAVVA